MPERTVVVASKVGLHARPAAVFVRAAAEQPARVTIRKDGEPVEASSILAIMALGVEHGDEVTLTAEGEQAEKSLVALVALLERDLDAEGTQPPAQPT